MTEKTETQKSQTQTETPKTKPAEKITADKKTIARCEQAREAAKAMGRTFVAAIFKTLSKQDNVKINVPKKEAKYLQFIPEHEILAFEGSALKRVVPVDVHAHYAHFDCPVLNEEGIKRPAVIRHFYVHPEFRGKTIVADVIIKEKSCLLTGRKTLVVDIVQTITGPTPVTVNHDFHLDIPVKGEKGEVLIPGAPDRCIQIAEIRPTQIVCDLASVIEAEQKVERDFITRLNETIVTIVRTVDAIQNN